MCASVIRGLGVAVHQGLGILSSVRGFCNAFILHRRYIYFVIYFVYTSLGYTGVSPLCEAPPSLMPPSACAQGSRVQENP